MESIRAGRARLVVGLPSWCEAGNIGAVTTLVDAALVSAGLAGSAVIVNADNDSPDGTAELFAATPTRVPKAALRTGRGKGSNEAALFRFALERDAVLLTLDADLRILPDDWVPSLTGPVLAGRADLTIPLLSRSWWDGTITNQLVAPLLLALTGEPVRQPIVGQYAFSPAAMRALLAAPWPSAALGFGWDVHMVLKARELGLRSLQVPVSMAGPLHAPRSATVEEIGAELSVKFVEVAVATLEGAAALPAPPATPLLVFPTAPARTGEQGDYDLAPVREFAARQWQTARSNRWTGRLLDRTSPLPDGTPPELDDSRWSRVLLGALGAVRGGPLIPEQLNALMALYIQRQLHVLPVYREWSPSRVDVAVHALAARLHADLLQAHGQSPERRRRGDR